jgi:hypothetical protein
LFLYNKYNKKIIFLNFCLVKYYAYGLQSENIQQKQNLIMAEIIENKMDHHNVPSMGKANAGLTLG